MNQRTRNRLEQFVTATFVTVLVAFMITYIIVKLLDAANAIF